MKFKPPNYEFIYECLETAVLSKRISLPIQIKYFFHCGLKIYEFHLLDPE